MALADTGPCEGVTATRGEACRARGGQKAPVNPVGGSSAVAADGMTQPWRSRNRPLVQLAIGCFLHNIYQPLQARRSSGFLLDYLGRTITTRLTGSKTSRHTRLQWTELTDALSVRVATEP